MSQVVQVAIARHVKTGRWVACNKFTLATVANAFEYVHDMNQAGACESHTDFQLTNGDWAAAKEVCRKRNERVPV